MARGDDQERSCAEAPTGPLVVGPTPRSAGHRIALSLVLPTYNEAHNVRALLEELSALLGPELGNAYELIVVDDDSPDRTWAHALDAAEELPCVRVVRRRGERGLSTAVIRGWQVARGEILGVMDADLQHPPGLNVELFRRMADVDLAVGSRHVSGGGVSTWSVARRILSRGAQLLGLVVLPGVLLRVSDPMSGYFLVRRASIQGVELDPLGYKILVEVVARGRIGGIAEVGYVFREREQGESKVTWRLYLDYVRHLVRLRWATLFARREPLTIGGSTAGGRAPAKLEAQLPAESPETS